eukprot:jgi/Chrzof1/9824/Cz04g17140.t1
MASCRHDLHLQIIYFGREQCTAKQHDPTACVICSWAAVPPYDRLGISPNKAGKALLKATAAVSGIVDGPFSQFQFTSTVTEAVVVEETPALQTPASSTVKRSRKRKTTT